jgi:hypothetical protein
MDLYLFAALRILDHVADVVIATVAGTGDAPLEGGVMRLYGVVGSLVGGVGGYTTVAAHGEHLLLSRAAGLARPRAAFLMSTSIVS